MLKARLLLKSQTQLRGAGTAHRRISWIDPRIASEPDSAGRRSVWDARIADKSSLAHCGLLAEPIEIFTDSGKVFGSTSPSGWADYGRAEDGLGNSDR
jgi:hypothetical protein